METRTANNKNRAFNLIEVCIIVGMIALLAIIFFPVIFTGQPQAMRRNPRINCVNNLKQDALAFKMWANDNDGKYPMQVSVTNGGAKEFAERGTVFPIFQVISNEINAPKILHCPADAKTIAATNFENDFNNGKISYFVGLDATEDSPNSILIGDDNYVSDGKPVSSGIFNLTSNAAVEWSDERHHRAGNIALTDGSAWQMSNDDWRKLVETNITSSRLVIP